MDKYKAACQIADQALAKTIEKCKPGEDIFKICNEIDKFIDEELRKVFNNKKSKKLERGIAFPTSISVNHIIGNYSPLHDESTPLNEGDLAKIELGCHLDGYIASLAHTILVSADSSKPLEGKQAQVLKCADACFRASQRLILEQGTNVSITETIAKICEEFKCTPVDGVFSHKLKRHIIDSNDAIANKDNPERRIEKCEFMPGDVFLLQVMSSTGEGKPREGDFRTTVYKREVENQYNLKSKHARAFFSEMTKKYPTLPFSIRSFEDQIGAKVGVKECVSHDLLAPYPVLVEKAGEFTAHFKCTIAI